LKNSAETNSGYSLFSIDEHRLSVGLLALVLLAAMGYGVWLAISPFIPKSAEVEASQSRSRLADSHFKLQEWTKAVEIYNQILKDDPENGYAVFQIATAWESQLLEKWQQYSGLESTTGSASASEELLAEETRAFGAVVNNWSKLLDNARFQRHAYERLASLHCTRSTYRDSKEELDKAVLVLDEMLKKGFMVSPNIKGRSDLAPLVRHPEFNRLVQEEKNISNLDSNRIFIRRQGGFNP